ncbi:uncharacterized mitochondrial protein AtMg01090-like [Arachis duranensis]|uniref:Uncharacterized mitochondrial protein AtMg01090-like n=1 Tax=Arachis duranensis TaxID=130453 RepID=A0A9C6TA66_ARADU|nr:uncharacterized mitochondrial protein AtMg01090-like [Arachis duranensis]
MFSRFRISLFSSFVVRSFGLILFYWISLDFILLLFHIGPLDLLVATIGSQPLDFGWTCHFDNGAGSSNLPALIPPESAASSEVGVGSHEGSSSGWTSFDLDVLAEEEDEVARPLPNPIDPGTEDRIYRAVDAINTNCKNEEARMVERAREIFLGKGVFLDKNDDQDIARAINMALYDAWETDIDRRLEQFRRIRRFLGTGNCPVWDDFIDYLVSLGNQKFNDPMYKK